jgi:hypothetical protein
MLTTDKAIPPVRCTSAHILCAAHPRTAGTSAGIRARANYRQAYPAGYLSV